MWNADLIRPSCFPLCEHAWLSAKQAQRCYVLGLLQVLQSTNCVETDWTFVWNWHVGPSASCQVAFRDEEGKELLSKPVSSQHPPAQPRFPAGAFNCVSRWSGSGPAVGSWHLCVMWIGPHTAITCVQTHTHIHTNTNMYAVQSQL